MSQTHTGEGGETVLPGLSAFQQNVLAVLADEAMYGLAIKRELETYYDDEVNHGRLYPNLDELVELGLVEKSQLDRRTNRYALTDRGRRTVLRKAAWLLDNYVDESTGRDDVERLLDDVV
ncbi:PadR family transcriptional regulator [Halobaculum sp. MBLA0147]|uniref:PadR family transcriptional regulator n=1 Tax=Halobaculum sp. MBLA0147 TaxID=3079934 RepID=UPI0035243165